MVLEMTIRTLIIVLFIAGFLCGCSDTSYMGPPLQKELFTKGPEGASELFSEGWRDGCATGSATASPQLQRLFHGFKINEHLVENDEYYNGWNKGFRHCHRYLYQYHRKGLSN